MDSDLISSLIGFFGGILAALAPLLYKEIRRYLVRSRLPKGVGPLSRVVLTSLDLSPRARKKLAHAGLIQVGATRYSLLNLVESAESSYSILAICGSKGNFAREYYEKNFRTFRSISRVFSYEAMKHEIAIKGERFALDGLRMHLDELNKKGNVTIFLIPEGKRIKDVGSGTFDPPLSFGFALIQEGNDLPVAAVLHWELEAKALRHLLSVEGIVVNKDQKELLSKLVDLFGQVARSQRVLSSKSNLKSIIEAYEKLEALWANHEAQDQEK